MTRWLTVEVTAVDIAQGEMGDDRACPIALAVHRAGYPDAGITAFEWYPDDASSDLSSTSVYDDEGREDIEEVSFIDETVADVLVGLLEARS